MRQRWPIQKRFFFFCLRIFKINFTSNQCVCVLNDAVFKICDEFVFFEKKEKNKACLLSLFGYQNQDSVVLVLDVHVTKFFKKKTKSKKKQNKTCPPNNTFLFLLLDFYFCSFSLLRFFSINIIIIIIYTC